MATIGLQYLKERLEYDVGTEFGNTQVLLHVWIRLFKGNHVRLIAFYEEIYEDREEPRHEPLIDVFLVTLAATILGGIVIQEYKAHRKRLGEAIMTVQRKCRLALVYLLDTYALKDMRRRRIIDSKEYYVLSKRLREALRKEGLIPKDVQEKVKPFYEQYGLSSSSDLLEALESTATKSKQSVSKQRENKTDVRRVDLLKSAASIEGLGASPGIAEGEVKTIWNKEDGKKVKKGDIAVFNCRFSPDMVDILFRCSAVIGMSGTGGMTGHLAVGARGIGLPAVVGILDEKRVIKEGLHAIIDGSSGKVYLT